MPIQIAATQPSPQDRTGIHVRIALCRGWAHRPASLGRTRVRIDVGDTRAHGRLLRQSIFQFRHLGVLPGYVLGIPGEKFAVVGWLQSVDDSEQLLRGALGGKELVPANVALKWPRQAGVNGAGV